MASYRFVTRWRIPASIDDVWVVLDAADRYGEWWPAFVEFRDMTPGTHGVGSRSKHVVKGVLPYSLRYVTVVTHYAPPHEVGYDATGELVGCGRFTVDSDGDETQVTFYWNVRTGGFWMNLLAPVFKPVFVWNHHRVMAQGERGLNTLLAKRAENSGHRNACLSNHVPLV
jgi:hypothetical protein